MFKKKSIFIIPLIISLFLFNSCERIDYSDMQEAVIKDMSWLDGCGYLIELSDGTYLQAINLNEFDIELEDNKEIWVKYHSYSNSILNTCMCGEVVEIEDLRER